MYRLSTFKFMFNINNGHRTTTETPLCFEIIIIYRVNVTAHECSSEMSTDSNRARSAGISERYLH